MNEKYILITGASKGLGNLLAKKMAHSGFDLCIVARNETLLRKFSAKLASETGRNIVPIVCNLANSNAVLKLINTIKKDFTSLEAIINNAAIHGPIDHFGKMIGIYGRKLSRLTFWLQWLYVTDFSH